MLDKILKYFKKENEGTSSSGDWGHNGRPGQVGGSEPSNQRGNPSEFSKARHLISDKLSEYIKNHKIGRNRKDTIKIIERLEKEFKKKWGAISQVELKSKKSGKPILSKEEEKTYKDKVKLVDKNKGDDNKELKETKIDPKQSYKTMQMADSYKEFLEAAKQYGSDKKEEIDNALAFNTEDEDDRYVNWKKKLEKDLGWKSKKTKLKEDIDKEEETTKKQQQKEYDEQTKEQEEREDWYNNSNDKPFNKLKNFINKLKNE